MTRTAYELTERGVAAAAAWFDSVSVLTHAEAGSRFVGFCWALEQTGSAFVRGSDTQAGTAVVYDVPRFTEPSLRHWVELDGRVS